MEKINTFDGFGGGFRRAAFLFSAWKSLLGIDSTYITYIQYFTLEQALALLEEECLAVSILPYTIMAVMFDIDLEILKGLEATNPQHSIREQIIELHKMGLIKRLTKFKGSTASIFFWELMYVTNGKNNLEISVDS